MSATRTVARFRIDADHPALPGHFPGHPVVPGVVVLEEVLLAAERAFGATALLGVPQAKFMSPLRPGIEAEVVLEAAGGATKFTVTAGGATIAQGTLELGERR
jgi:3-hydroxyacyl-[acyl-carrier-protein] dehydratase